MFEVTDSAIAKIAEYFKTNEVRPIRILLNPGG